MAKTENSLPSEASTPAISSPQLLPGTRSPLSILTEAKVPLSRDTFGCRKEKKKPCSFVEIVNVPP